MNDVRILDQRLPEDRERAFLPGMGKTWLLPCYDTMSRLIGARRLQERAVAIAGIRPRQSVLDVGCGTGNLALAALAAAPTARVTGLDPDQAALRRAARKAVRRGVPLTLTRAYADHLPAEDASVDHVISSFALHHVDDEGRPGFAREAYRVLRPGGRITIVDMGSDEAPRNHDDHDHGPSHLLRHLRRPQRERTLKNPYVARNLSGALVALLQDAGFSEAHEAEHREVSFGPVTFVQATKP